MGEVYVDTNVFLDYWLSRSDALRPLGEFAFQFIKRALQCEFTVLLTPDTVAELAKVLKATPARARETVLLPLIRCGKLKEVIPAAGQEMEARRVASKYAIPRADALYAIMARDDGAPLVTQDNHMLGLAGKGEFVTLSVTTPALV